MEENKGRDGRLSFVFYLSWLPTVFSFLSDVQLGTLIRIIYSYQKTGVSPPIPDDLKMPFAYIKDQLDRDHEAWLSEKEVRSRAGKKGMENRWKKEQKTSEESDKKTSEKTTKKYVENSVKNIKKTHNSVMKNNNSVIKNDNSVTKNITQLPKNITVNVNDNVNVNVNDNVNVNGLTDSAREKNTFENEVLTVSQSKFLREFPDKKIDCDVPKNFQLKKLIDKINHSEFLKARNFPLSWYLKNHKEIFADKYINFDRSPVSATSEKTATTKTSKSSARKRDYTPELLEGLYSDLDSVEI